MIECSLCGMIFYEKDSLLDIRLARHTEFHEKAQIQKRNTTHGTPVFNDITVNGVKRTLTNDDERRCK